MLRPPLLSLLVRGRPPRPRCSKSDEFSGAIPVVVAAIASGWDSSCSSSLSSRLYRLKCKTRNFHTPVSALYEISSAPIFLVFFKILFSNLLRASSEASAPPSLGKTSYMVMTAGRLSFEPSGGLVPFSSSASYTATSRNLISTTVSRSTPRTSTAPSHAMLPRPSLETTKSETAARSASDICAMVSTEGDTL